MIAKGWTIAPAGSRTDEIAGWGYELTTESLNSTIPLKALKYDRMNSFILGTGLLAWGSKNGRAYFQILWIPIPLWSVE
jgi:hypothetical protein